ncbi:lipopolysaccharide biosynthesis protein [Escherichia coli]|nr:hypothetical protein [Escherichia coli]EIH9369703.1 hypothetical protein [Escherichia coli]ELD0467365.1 hypothetical protein [Escherichia coli]MQK14654.1 hypothetical protein [Escherichia coli]HAW1912278.1 hypothetical protein [Escherichia coli]HAW2027170.1 hypothetical protein [Escherichia coli]
MNHKQFINISIRASTMLSRFMLMFIIAKHLPDEDMGMYGLFTSAIVFSLYAVGLDFYIYSTRELINTNKVVWGQFLKTQSVLVTLLYLTYIPFLIFLFYFDYLPWKVFLYFIIILIFEHICQELQRIIIAAHKPLAANLGLFARSGLWPIFFIPLFYWGVIPRSLDYLFIAWIIGNVISIIFYFYILMEMRISGWKNEIQWTWLMDGIKVSIVFLIGTLALRFSSVIERFWLQELTTLKIVGVYSFFVGISGVITSFLDAGVFSFQYPRLIKAENEKNLIQYNKIRRELYSQVCLWIGGLAGISLILFKPTLAFIDKNIYYEYQKLYYFTLGTTIFSSFALLPHYELYAKKRDKAIVTINILSIIVFILTALVTISVSKLYAIPAAALFTQLFILIAKYISLKSINKNECIDFD